MHSLLTTRLRIMLAIALTVVAGFDSFAALAQPADHVVIPNFWDPKRRLERPTTGAITAIRFVTTDDYPPFNFVDASGRLTGFNVDLARAICAELGIPCTIQARPWNDLVNALAAHTADAAIAGIAISADTRRDLDFSDPYLRSPARFVVRNGSSLSPDAPGLKGHSVSVAGGSAHEAYLAALFPEIDRKPYPTAEAARQALKDGKVDASFGDGIQLSIWLQSESAGNCCAFTGGPYLETRYFGEGLAIAVPKGAADLKHALNNALQAVYDKGTYAELYLKYFPVGFY